MFNHSLAHTIFSVALILVSNTYLYGGWPSPTNPTTLSSHDSNAAIPQISTDGHGNAIAVWEKPVTSINTIQFSRYAFDTAQWSSTEILSDSGIHSTDPFISLNSTGNGIAVWCESVSGSTYIAASLYSMETNSWSRPSAISGANASSPKAAIDSAGNIIAVWIHFDGTSDLVQSSRFNVLTSSWSTPADLSLPNGDASGVQVVLNSIGNGFVLWSRSDPIYTIIQAIHYDVSGDIWSRISDLSLTGENASNPDIAIDPNGNAVAVWQRFNGNHYIVQANHYSSHTGLWAPSSQATDLSLPGASATLPQIDLDQNGNGIAIWQRPFSGVTTIQSSYYSLSNNTWTTHPVNLFTGGFGAGSLQVVMTPLGNASAIFHRFDGSCFVIYACDFDLISGTWSTNTTALSLSEVGQSSTAPKIATDPYGNITAVWTKFDGTYNIIQAAAHTHITSKINSSASVSESIITADGKTSSTITITLVDDLNLPVSGHNILLEQLNGNSVIKTSSSTTDLYGKVTFTVVNSHVEHVIYRITDTTNNITIVQMPSVTFTIAAPLPPTNFRGRISLNKHATHTAITHTLYWEASPDPKTVGYRIYQNGKVIYATMNADRYKVVIRNRRPKESYTLVAVNANGEESAPVVLSLP